jgi:hypothetical protein
LIGVKIGANDGVMMTLLGDATASANSIGC